MACSDKSDCIEENVHIMMRIRKDSENMQQKTSASRLRRSECALHLKKKQSIKKCLKLLKIVDEGM